MNNTVPHPSEESTSTPEPPPSGPRGRGAFVDEIDGIADTLRVVDHAIEGIDTGGVDEHSCRALRAMLFGVIQRVEALTPPPAEPVADKPLASATTAKGEPQTPSCASCKSAIDAASPRARLVQERGEVAMARSGILEGAKTPIRDVNGRKTIASELRRLADTIEHTKELSPMHAAQELHRIDSKILRTEKE